MYSLWMIPSSTRFNELEDQISTIANRFQTAAFLPHITLVSQINGIEKDLAKLTTQLETTILPLELSLKGVGHSEEFFRALYYQFLDNDSLIIAREKAAEAFGIPLPTEYMPHLSLAYGNITTSNKYSVIQKNGFPIGKSHSLLLDQLWLVNTSLPVEKWEKVML